MIGLHSYIIDLSSDGKWANEQRQTDEPGYNEDIIHTFMNGLPFKPCNTTLYTGNYANDSHRTDSQHELQHLFSALQSRTLMQTLWFIETCPYPDDNKDDKDPGTLLQRWMHVITLFRHGHTCITPRSKITGTYKVMKRTLWPMEPNQLEADIMADGTKPTWQNGHLIFSHGIQATFRSWKEAQSRKHSQ